jgi:hypothetical protein
MLVKETVWIVPALLLFVVAWKRFNSPPTNRSGTTFVLFTFGVIFYYALILAIWLLLIISISQGSIGLGKLSVFLGNHDPESSGELGRYAPIFAALFIVVASQFRQVSALDGAARSFCIQLASIPREADSLALELAQSTDFQPANQILRALVSNTIAQNIGPKALNFSNDGTPSARFTRAVGLYWLFVGPRNNGNLALPAGSKSVYSRIVQLGESTASRADARYEELMQRALAYFTSPHPTKELKDALERDIMELSSLVCSLIARFVLYCEVTRAGRRERLSVMGFDRTHSLPRFGRDQWVTTILAVIFLSIGMMAFMPGTRSIGTSQILVIAITFGISIGFAVLGAILVAQRFIERHQGEQQAFPPIAELTLAALIVTGLSVGLRIAIPLVPALIQGDGLQNTISQFIQRWPGVITPFVGTISLGLLCSYLGSQNWSWLLVASIGAVGNGLAFAAAGLMVGSLINPEVLALFYRDPDNAVPIIVMSTGLTGILVGAMVLAVFNKSQRVRKEVVGRSADDPSTNLPEVYAPPLVDHLETMVLPSPNEAPQNLGGYVRTGVEVLEGTYVCFRPAFSATDVINAYVIVIRWDEATSCLMFEEQDRVDVGHTQKGTVFIPEGGKFINLATVERGAMRLIMVSRPQGEEPARGLIMTMSNSERGQFTPVSAPIVLRRVVKDMPQLGFVKASAPDYSGYRRELERVMPPYGSFVVTPPQPALADAAE